MIGGGDNGKSKLWSTTNFMLFIVDRYQKQKNGVVSDDERLSGAEYNLLVYNLVRIHSCIADLQALK